MTPTSSIRQLEAITAVQAHLHTPDRVSVLVACAGRTLVGRWLAEQHSAAGWMFEALIICSDPSTADGSQERVGSDGEDIQPPSDHR